MEVEELQAHVVRKWGGDHNGVSPCMDQEDRRWVGRRGDATSAAATKPSYS